MREFVHTSFLDPVEISDTGVGRPDASLTVKVSGSSGVIAEASASSKWTGRTAWTCCTGLPWTEAKVVRRAGWRSTWGAALARF